MTRYHVLVNDELMSDPDFQTPSGFRFIEPVWPGEDGYTRWWLAEDDDAPEGLEMHRVEPGFTQHGDRTVITSRRIVDHRGYPVKQPEPS